MSESRASREAVALLCEIARNAGESAIPVYAPGIVELAQFYLDNTQPKELTA